MSHHYSGPNFGFPHANPRLDFTDLYAFPKAGDANTSVLIMNVHPSDSFQPPGPPVATPLWETRRAFWADRAANEERVRANMFSLKATRQRHVGASPHPERYDPDLWTDEFAFLSRPKQAELQLDLFFDYRTNVASYPAWQHWLRRHQPSLLVLWGVYDPSFMVAGASAYRDDVPGADVHLLQAGHFAMDEAPGQIAELTGAFMGLLAG
jgi:pimeloyl-ACP methyl ester carboxylesterase